MDRPGFNSFESIPKSGLAGSHERGLSILKPNWNWLPALPEPSPAPHLPPALCASSSGSSASHLPPPVNASELSLPDSRPSCPPATPPAWSPPSWGFSYTCTAKMPRPAPARGVSWHSEPNMLHTELHRPATPSSPRGTSCSQGQVSPLTSPALPPHKPKSCLSRHPSTSLLFPVWATKSPHPRFHQRSAGLPLGSDLLYTL